MNFLTTNFSSLLSIPVAFLLQEYELKQLESLQDEHSLSLMHWSVLTNDVTKIAELISFNFKYNVYTHSNILNSSIYDYQKLVDYPQYYSIPFCKKGYTSVHLNVFLHSIHSNIAKSNKKGNFKSNDFIKNQIDIFNLFIKHDSNIFSLEDDSGYSILDYCFLLENITLINLALKIDSSLSGLKIVKTKTAIKIIETIQLKYDIMNIENVAQININPFILDCLNKKYNYEVLNEKVDNMSINNNDNNKTRGKI